MKHIKVSLMTLILCVSSLLGWLPAAMAQGGPGPWPFPWARECPVQWESLSGHYFVGENSQEGRIDLQIKVTTKQGLRLVRITRYGDDGGILSTGATFIGADQRAVSVNLISIADTSVVQKTVLRLHYLTPEYTCNAENLVLVLTMEQSLSGATQQEDYRLIPIPNKAN